MSEVSLVTGGAGFMGSHVARALLERGHRVVVLDDLSGGHRANIHGGIEFVQGSILDIELIRKLFEGYRFDYVFHLAAYAAEGLSHFIRNFNYSHNVLGSVNLINASVRSQSVKRFVFTSSIAVYGSAQTPMAEETTPRPEDPYGISKYAVELDLAAANHMFGLEYTIFRPHNVYGEHQNIGDRYRNVVGIFMNQVMKGEPMSVFGDGLQTRAFTYIGDVAPLMAESVNISGAKNAVINVGSESPRTVLDVAHAVAKAFSVKPNIRHFEARNEVVHAFSTSTLSNALFGHREVTTLEAGIERMARWARQHGPRETPAFANIEVERNLPASWRI